MIIFYLGPQTVLPLASVIAAVIGFVAIFWRNLVGIGRKFVKTIFRRQEKDADPNSETD